MLAIKLCHVLPFVHITGCTVKLLFCLDSSHKQMQKNNFEHCGHVVGEVKYL